MEGTGKEKKEQEKKIKNMEQAERKKQSDRQRIAKYASCARRKT
jgi:hypothetical protein